MNIELANLPEEGIDLSGKIPAEIFALPDKDAKADSPLVYDIHVQKFDNELLLNGFLSASFMLNCVRTLHSFRKTIELPRATVSIDVAGLEVIDPSETLREEILLQLPTNPVCDDGDEPQHCEIDSKYLALDKDPGSDLENSHPTAGDSRWAALDDLEASEEDAN